MLLSVIPELLTLLTTGLLAIAGRKRWSRVVSSSALFLILIALIVELWPASTPVDYWGYQQSRFTLLGKAILLVVLLVILVLSWGYRSLDLERLSRAALITAVGMLALSATWLPLTWIGFVILILLGISQTPKHRVRSLSALVALLLTGIGLLGLGGVEHTLSWTGLHPLHPINWIAGVSIILILSGVLIPLTWLPWFTGGGDVRGEERLLASSILGGLVTGGSALLAIKMGGYLVEVGLLWGPYLAILAALALILCGLAVVASPPRIERIGGWLAGGQLGWMVAGLATHDQLGVAAGLFLLAPVVVAAAALPLMVTSIEGRELSGMARRHPRRWLGISLVLLSLAGVAPLAGFVTDLAVVLELLFAHLAWLAVLGLLSLALGWWRVIRLLNLVWLGSEELDRRRRGNPALPGWPLAMLGVGLLLVVYVLAAGPISQLAVQSSEALGIWTV